MKSKFIIFISVVVALYLADEYLLPKEVVMFEILINGKTSHISCMISKAANYCDDKIHSLHITESDIKNLHIKRVGWYE